MVASGTPATALLTKQKIAFRLHPYEHDPRAQAYGEEAAAALGARAIKVGDFTNQQCPMPKLIERFSGLCREAADHGTRIAFEMMPFRSPTPSPSLSLKLRGYI